MGSFGTHFLGSVGKTKHPYNFQLVSCLSPHSNTQAILGFASSTVGSKGLKYPSDPTVILFKIKHYGVRMIVLTKGLWYSKFEVGTAQTLFTDSIVTKDNCCGPEDHDSDKR